MANVKPAPKQPVQAKPAQKAPVQQPTKPAPKK